MLDTSYESTLWAQYPSICGIDEVGRGPLAGPVVAAAVVFPRYFKPSGILCHTNDSKRLSKIRRQEISQAIKDNASCYAIAEIDHLTIDRLNILQASILAMQNAVKHLKVLPNYLLIDGISFNDKLNVPYETIKKGDGKVFSIAAASILAKVHRDQLMRSYDSIYPGYGFKDHAGYATKKHIDAIKTLGRSEIHRKSFKLACIDER
jgi:ribonuclease HII